MLCTPEYVSSFKLITFVHTLMRNGDDTDVHTALVVCPLNTVLNWQREWVMWSEELPDDEVYDVSNAGLKFSFTK